MLAAQSDYFLFNWNYSIITHELTKDLIINLKGMDQSSIDEQFSKKTFNDFLKSHAINQVTIKVSYDQLFITKTHLFDHLGTLRRHTLIHVMVTKEHYPSEDDAWFKHTQPIQFQIDSPEGSENLQLEDFQKAIKAIDYLPIALSQDSKTFNWLDYTHLPTFQINPQILWDDLTEFLSESPKPKRLLIRSDFPILPETLIPHLEQHHIDAITVQGLSKEDLKPYAPYFLANKEEEKSEKLETPLGIKKIKITLQLCNDETNLWEDYQPDPATSLEEKLHELINTPIKNNLTGFQAFVLFCSIALVITLALTPLLAFLPWIISISLFSTLLIGAGLLKVVKWRLNTITLISKNPYETLLTPTSKQAFNPLYSTKSYKSIENYLQAQDKNSYLESCRKSGESSLHRNLCKISSKFLNFLISENGGLAFYKKHKDSIDSLDFAFQDEELRNEFHKFLQEYTFDPKDTELTTMVQNLLLYFDSPPDTLPTHSA